MEKDIENRLEELDRRSKEIYEEKEKLRKDSEAMKVKAILDSGILSQLKFEAEHRDYLDLWNIRIRTHLRSDDINYKKLRDIFNKTDEIVAWKGKSIWFYLNILDYDFGSRDAIITMRFNGSFKDVIKSFNELHLNVDRSKITKVLESRIKDVQTELNEKLQDLEEWNSE